VTQRYFTGVEYLAFKVIQETYDSDPDIFISTVSSQCHAFNTLLYRPINSQQVKVTVCGIASKMAQIPVSFLALQFHIILPFTFLSNALTNVNTSCILTILPYKYSLIVLRLSLDLVPTQPISSNIIFLLTLLMA
jgi:hypothetical protein